MSTRNAVFKQVAVWGVIALLAGAAFVATMPELRSTITHWFTGKSADDDKAKAAPHSHELVRKAGQVVKPYTMWLAQESVKGLQVTSLPATKPSRLELAPQGGTLGYDTDLLFSIRPRFQGEVIEIGKPIAIGKGSQPEGKERLLGPGDFVPKGHVLAVTWCKEIGDRKVALIAALLNLYLDEELLKRQEIIYKNGSLPEASYRTQVNKVEQDQASVYAAETSLGIARMSPEEIEKIREEAKTIQKRIQGAPETTAERQKRLGEEVQKWARVEVLAPQDGIIVEKNTNVHDMVDPSKDTPLFRIADLRSLQVVVNFAEEYLPMFQPLVDAANQGKLSWTIRFPANPDLGALELPIVRIAPSVDPNQHTIMVIGRIANPPDKSTATKLIVGQFVTATIDVPPLAGTVSIPTNALNEVNGESLVFVQPSKDRNEFVLRRVAVVRRSKDSTLVKSVLSAQDGEFSEQEIKAGRRPLEEIHDGDLVVIRGVTEMTEALDELLAKLRTEK